MTAEPGVERDTPLAHILKTIIRRSGPMPVATYMAHCLWDGDHGYYATKTVLGRDGDFITASDISQTFGELLGLWAGIVWQQVMGGPPQIRLVEYGPGRGTLMRDAVRATRVVPGFQAAASVRLVEMSATLHAEQQAALADCALPVTWGQNLAGFTAPAIIFANEFLDSWPVTQWVKTPNGWRMRAVDLDAAGQFVFTILDDTAINSDFDLRFPGAPAGSIVERLDHNRFAAALKLVAASGPVAAVIIDYGYTDAASGDTLQALRGHAYESPFASPGEADLTTHVNFLDLAIALHHAGFELDGPVTQAEFLGSLGIIERASRLMAANPNRAGEIETGIARLMAPNGMGSRFKVIGVRSPLLPPLPGFAAAKVFGDAG